MHEQPKQDFYGSIKETTSSNSGSQVGPISDISAIVSSLENTDHKLTKITEIINDISYKLYGKVSTFEDCRSVDIKYDPAKIDGIIPSISRTTQNQNDTISEILNCLVIISAGLDV